MRQTQSSKLLKDREVVTELYPTQRILAKITELASIGYSGSTIGYLLGASQELWAELYLDHEDVVNAAINEGKIQGEIEAIAWLRNGAKQCNNFTALKYYGEMRYGWGNGAGNVELPTGIAFTMIVPEKDEDDG